MIGFVRNVGETRVMDVAAELGVARSSAHRILQALVHRDFLEVEDHIYRAGPALSAAPTISSQNRRLRQTATAHLRALVERVGNSTNLMVRHDAQVRFLASFTARGSTADRRGAIMPARRTAGGKAMLSLLDSGQLSDIYLRRHPEPGFGRSEFEQLLEQLRRVRKHDFASSAAEVETEVSALGTALRAPSGKGIGAVTISLRCDDLTSVDISPLVRELLGTRDAIEREWAVALTR